MKIRSSICVIVLMQLFFSCTKQNIVENKQSASNNNAQAITRKSRPIGAVYVEVNSNNILNSGCYTLQNGGQQLFDIAMIFAANINYDVTHKRAVEYNNENVTRVLQNREQYIAPLQDKGIKVLLTILGNHQGAGISNF